MVYQFYDCSWRSVDVKAIPLIASFHLLLFTENMIRFYLHLPTELRLIEYRRNYLSARKQI